MNQESEHNQYRYQLSFCPGCLSEDQSIIHYFDYSSSGYKTALSLPLYVGVKVDTSVFTSSQQNSFQPVEYYPRKFKGFPKVEYAYGIVADIVLYHTDYFSEELHGAALVFLIAIGSSAERMQKWSESKNSQGQFLTYPNPSPRNLNW